MNTQNLTETKSYASALRSLRHLYENLVNGCVRDTAQAKRIATGLLGPAIEELEYIQKTEIERNK